MTATGQAVMGAEVTGPAIMGVDRAVALPAIMRDLACYGEQWMYLQQSEVEDAYGPIHPDRAEMQQLSARGTCIPAATLSSGDECTLATWDGQIGQHFGKGSRVVISRQHPKVDQLGSCSVSSSSPGRLHLNFQTPDVDPEPETWRLDLRPNYVPWYRASTAIESFTTVGNPRRPRLCNC